MKRIFDFVFCQGDFSPDVVWYSVRVGRSASDQRAHSFVAGLAAGSSDFLYAQHCPQLAALRQGFANSLYGAGRSFGCASPLLIRQCFVSVRWLARFLRQYPAALLNSEKIPTPLTRVSVILSGITTSAGYQLRSYHSLHR